MTIARGRLVLRLRVDKAPGLREVCTVEASPVFVSRAGFTPGSGMSKGEAKELLRLGFRVKMGPGDFVVVGPSGEVAGGMNLGAFFFSRAAPSSGGRMFVMPPGPKRQGPVPYYGPVVRIYVILCTDVSL